MKINFGYKTDQTLKYSVYSPASVAREENIELPESPAGSCRYIAFSNKLQEGDDVIVKNDSDIPVGYGEFLKEGLTWVKNG